MSKIDYEIRKDGNGCMFAAESESELLDTEMLLDDYPYIQEAMDKENYHVKNSLCYVFDEIVFENKVVGFATYDVINNFEVILTECYILPEFRGNRLFFDEICKMHFSAPRFGILQPTRNVMELLLNYAFAKYATDGIVVSAIDLYLDSFDIRSNKRGESFRLIAPPTNFYDSRICSTIFVSEDEVFYHRLLANDCLMGHNRNNLDKGYFDDIVKLFSKNHDEFENLIAELKDELPDNKLGYDVLVGYGNGLSEYMQGMVDREILSYEKAMEIRQQLIKEYESGEIDDSTIEDRFIMLSASQTVVIENFDDLKELVNSNGFYDEAGFFEDLVNVVGDNDQLGNDLFNALLQGNETEFHRLMLNQLENDDEFFENFSSLLGDDFDEYAVEFLDDFDVLLEDDFDLEEFEEKRKQFVKETLDEKYRLNIEYDDPIPIGYEKEFYLVLDALDKGENYYDALGFVEYESLVSPELLTKLLLDSKFIKKDGKIEIDWIEEAHELDNVDLKKILASNNLDFEGTRQECLHFLAENNVSLGDAYKITPEGKKFLKESVWIGLYWDFLDDFDFDDYCRYLDNHNGDLKELSLSYLDEHIKLARKSDDEFYLEDCLFVKEEISVDANEFIIELNNRE